MGDGIEVDLRLRIARQDTEITALREDLATEKTRYRELWVIERALREEVEELGRFNTDLQCRWGSMENRAINAEAKVAELEKAHNSTHAEWVRMMIENKDALEAQLRAAREALEEVREWMDAKIDWPDYDDLDTILAGQEAEPCQDPDCGDPECRTHWYGSKPQEAEVRYTGQCKHGRPIGQECEDCGRRHYGQEPDQPTDEPDDRGEERCKGCAKVICVCPVAEPDKCPSCGALQSTPGHYSWCKTTTDPGEWGGGEHGTQEPDTEPTPPVTGAVLQANADGTISKVEQDDSEALTAAWMVGFHKGKTGEESTYVDLLREAEARGMEMLMKEECRRCRYMTDPQRRAFIAAHRKGEAVRGNRTR